MGADDYVTKPFDVVMIFDRISACIEKKLLRDKENITEEIRKKKEKSDSLLLNILPKK
ncbi:MAG: hypothetical protein CM15mP44_5600 [Candidatus Neomarinimicrobiota bacterium]|nr:MAG: hypothetical protein CM15mP44_5600 [Candidatus Neomarinimicrobiota bacterium]